MKLIYLHRNGLNIGMERKFYVSKSYGRWKVSNKKRKMNNLTTHYPFVVFFKNFGYNSSFTHLKLGSMARISL